MKRLNLTIMAYALAAVSTTALAAPPTETPVRGGTVIFGSHLSEPSSYDCHATASNGPVVRLAPHYSTLLKLDAVRYPEVRGDLARSWTISSDGLTYEFKLHPNVKFHDGTALTANDVKVSYDRLRNPPPGVVSMHTKLFSDIKAIDAPDPTTVVVRLSRPNAAMLQLLAIPFGCVYSADLLAKDPSYPSKKIMGSGPFKFVSNEAGKQWEGARFDGYFKAGQPYLDGFRVLAVTPPVGLNALQAGQVHYLGQGLTKADLARIKEARGDKVYLVNTKNPTALQLWFAINTQRPPLNDVRVRQALQLAIDHASGAKAAVSFSALNRVGGLIRPGSPFARSDTELAKLPGFGDINESRKKARSLLAEAGQSNLKLTMINASVFSFLGVFVTDQLRQIGVTVDHRVVPGAQLLARRASGDFDLILDNPPEYLDDPTVQLAYFLPFKDNPINVSRVDDDTFTELYTAQAREMDSKAREAKVRKLEEYLLDKAYVIPLFWQDWQRAISSDVGGLEMELASPYLKTDLSDIWLRSGGKAPQ